MKQYVLTVAVRDPDHPCDPDQVLIESGHEARLLADALQNLADALRHYKTPEKLARAMREHKRTLLLPSKGP